MITKKHIIYLASILIVGFSLVFTSPTKAQTTNGNVSGYAWSSTVGWISFNCSDLGICSASPYWVQVTPDTNGLAGTFSGYAWSSGIGWISFNAPDVSSCGPVAKLDFTSKAVTGWARAISGGSAQSAGWDGCISLSGANPAYGVTFNQGPQTLTGFAWGSMNVGWIGFTHTKLNLVLPGQQPGAGPYFTFLVNGAPTAAVNSGDAVTLSWETKQIQSCSISGDLTQTFTGTNVADTPPNHSYVVSNITSAKSYTMTCTSTTNTTLPPQTVTVTIKPAACAVIPDKVVIKAGSGAINTSVLFGAEWTNTTGFPSVSISNGSVSPAGFGTTISGITGNPVTALNDPVSIAVGSSSAVTTTQVIPIQGTSATGPVSSCTPAALYIVPAGKCQDPLASNVGGDLPCTYDVNTKPNTKRPPWEEV